MLGLKVHKSDLGSSEVGHTEPVVRLDEREALIVDVIGEIQPFAGLLMKCKVDCEHLRLWW